MFQTLLTNLTREQRIELRAFGIEDTLLSHWRANRRIPTQVQTVALAEICKVDRHALQDEIALLRATPEQRRLLESLMGKLKGGAVAMLFCGFVAVAFSVAPGGGGSRFSRSR